MLSFQYHSSSAEQPKPMPLEILTRAAETMGALKSFYGESERTTSGVAARKRELDQLPEGPLKDRLKKRQVSADRIQISRVYRRFHPDGFVEGKNVSLIYQLTETGREKKGVGTTSVRNRSGTWQIIGEKAILQKERPWKKQEEYSLEILLEALLTDAAPEIEILETEDKELYHIRVMLPEISRQRLADIRNAEFAPVNPSVAEERTPVFISYFIGKANWLLYGEEHELKSGEIFQQGHFDRVEANPKFNDSTFRIPKGVAKVDGRSPTLNLAHMLQELEKSVGKEVRPIEDVIEEVVRLTQWPVDEPEKPRSKNAWVALVVGLGVIVLIWQFKIRA